ncbi:MAG TPA: amidohydrolase family protein [Terriglobales bacterium]|nr:amidohydrolase family protein [Terriglobales bacterium]
MIVDCHTHVGEPEHFTKNFIQDARTASGNPNQQLAVKLPDHWKAMQSVDKAIVLGFRAQHVGYTVPNEYVANYVKQHPEKLIGFCSIDPHDDDAVEQLDHAVLKLGLRGLKLGPIYQNVHPSDQKIKRLFKRAEELGTPIVIHQGTTFCCNVSLEVADPVLLQPIALEFPRLRMVIAHMGHPWIGETISLIRKHPFLFADISALHYRPWQFYNALVLASEYRVMHKLLLGSDYPVTTPAETIAGLKKVNQFTVGTALPRVSEADIDDLIYRDTLKLLDLV